MAHLTASQVIEKVSKSAPVIMVVSPLNTKGEPQSYTREPFSPKAVKDLPKGKQFRLRFYAKAQKYIATVTMTTATKT